MNEQKITSAELRLDDAVATKKALQETLSAEEARLLETQAAIAENLEKTKAADPDGSELEKLSAARMKLEARAVALTARVENFRQTLKTAAEDRSSAELALLNAQIKRVEDQVQAGASAITGAARAFLAEHKARIAELNALRKVGHEAVERRRHLLNEPPPPHAVIFGAPTFGSVWTAQEPRLNNQPTLQFLAMVIGQEEEDARRAASVAARLEESGLLRRVASAVAGAAGLAVLLLVG